MSVPCSDTEIETLGPKVRPERLFRAWSEVCREAQGSQAPLHPFPSSYLPPVWAARTQWAWPLPRLTSTVMVPWRGPMVCSVSRPSSSRYSHSTPMAMKDLELGSTSFSSFSMNLPVSRFLTAENGRRQPVSPRGRTAGRLAGYAGLNRLGELQGTEPLVSQLSSARGPSVPLTAQITLGT